MSDEFRSGDYAVLLYNITVQVPETRYLHVPAGRVVEVLGLHEDSGWFEDHYEVVLFKKDLSHSRFRLQAPHLRKLRPLELLALQACK